VNTAWIFKLPPRLRAWLVRVGFNLHPPFRGTGGRITYVSDDLLQMRARLPHSWKTKNIVGSIYGGSLFAVTDGPHPMMLMAALGPSVVVWDKNATIRYRKPAFTELTVDFILSDGDLAAIRAALDSVQECSHRFVMDLIDSDGQSHATIERIIYIAKKSFYQEKIKQAL
jgi:hypothetical protein